MTPDSFLVLTHPSCPVQEAEARAIVRGSKMTGVFGPGSDLEVTVSTSSFVQPGRAIVVNLDKLTRGLEVPVGR